MYEDDRELIVRLCTRAGLMMEDANAVAIGTAGLRLSALDAAVNDLFAITSDVPKIMNVSRLVMKSSVNSD